MNYEDPHSKCTPTEFRSRKYIADSDCPANTVASWLQSRRSRDSRIDRYRTRCDVPPRKIEDPASYCYPLGQYLGDGHLLMTQRVPLMTTTYDSRYLGLIHEVSHAMTACGVHTLGYQEKPGCISVRSHRTHWPRLIPQHGPGPKHHRKIELADGEQEIVAAFPGRLTRDLFRSDGTRFLHRVMTRGKTYSYPRYMFVNESGDIMRICQKTLDSPGVKWRMPRRNSLSVAKRKSVALLDELAGPKW